MLDYSDTFEIVANISVYISLPIEEKKKKKKKEPKPDDTISKPKRYNKRNNINIL
jgi:hypothetical protein